MIENIDFLLNSDEPWTVYRTLVDIMELDEGDNNVMIAKKQVLDHLLVKGLIDELHQWPGTVISSHKSAGQLYHKLSFVADIGLKKEDDEIKGILKKVTEHESEEGLFQLPINTAKQLDGVMEEKWAWALCDAPLLIYSVAKMGMADYVQVQTGIRFLASLARENGWPCAVSKELDRFRGPGRKGDPCPYANLIMLKLLALFEEYKDSREAHIGVECLLGLWEKSKESHPYMFYMGTDFRKLKAPYIWYDILHVVEVLSQYEFALKDHRFSEMLDVINSKASKDGLFTPESEWRAWKGWDFGQKKRPSTWMTFLVYRINKRAKTR